MKNIVLDTSAILSDLGCLHGNPDQTLVVPLGVLEELNRLKHEKSSARGKAARDAVSLIWSYCQYSEPGEPIDLPGGGKMIISWKGEGLTDSVDDQVIKLAQLMEASVASDDIALKVKAHLLGVKTEGEDIGSDVDPFDTEGYEERFVDSSMIDALYANSPIIANFSCPENRYFVLRDEQNPKHSVLARYKEGFLHRLKTDKLIAWDVKPENVEQKFFMDMLLDDSLELVVAQGGAGTGKSYLALAAALEKVLEENKYEKILLVKSVVAIKGQDLGFLPGDFKEKILPVYANLISHLERLFKRREDLKMYMDNEKGKAKIILEPAAYMRGKDYVNSLIIIDEAQNFTDEDARVILSRVGVGSKVVMLGDPSQIDVPGLRASQCGLVHVTQSFVNQAIVGIVTLKNCLRSRLAKLAIELL